MRVASERRTRKLAILLVAVLSCVYKIVKDSVKSYMAGGREGIGVDVTHRTCLNKDSRVHACTCMSPYCRERGTFVSLAFLILTSPSIVSTRTSAPWSENVMMIWKPHRVIQDIRTGVDRPESVELANNVEVRRGA
jgi:hypothetical protein